MLAYCRKFPLKYTKDFDQKILKYHFRYNSITDLMIRSPQQIDLCLDRVSQLFHQSYGEEFEIDLSLYACFFYDENKPDIDPLPLCEFTCIDIYKYGVKLDSILGVMFSSYLHDYDRENISEFDKATDDFPVTTTFWTALFQPHPLNNYEPPLDKYPILIFPQDKSKIDVPSATNSYMEMLGFDLKIDYLDNGLPFRLFQHRGDRRLDSPPVKTALVSCGQVFLEMLMPNLYPSNTGLTPFDRVYFNGEVKQQQKLKFINWLEQHELVFDSPEVVAV